MRALLAVAFVIVTSVAAFTYRDLLLDRRSNVQRPATFRLGNLHQPLAPFPLSANAERGDVMRTLAELAVIDSQINHHMMVIQEAPDQAPPMVELAFFYMKRGWFDRAVGPLARAREIAGQNEEIGRYLELAVARSGKGYVDLSQAARDFVAIMEEWGHGC
jgi:hypothetical protein